MLGVVHRGWRLHGCQGTIDMTDHETESEPFTAEPTDSRGEPSQGTPVVIQLSGRIDLTRYGGGKVPAERCPAMPDLAGGPDLPGVFLNMVLGRTGVTEGRHAHLWLNFVRLVDLATFEYEETQSAVKEMVSGCFQPYSTPGVRAANRMEQCISAAHRAVRFGVSLHEASYLPAGLLPPASSRSHLEMVRHSIEHLEERVLGSRADEGPFMLEMRDSGVRISGRDANPYCFISYADLAATLAQLRACVAHVAHRGEDPQPTLPADAG